MDTAVVSDARRSNARKQRLWATALLPMLVLPALSVWLTSERAERAERVAVVSAALAATRREPLELAADGLPIKPHDPRAAQPEGPMHPHPITPAHERIYRENDLVGALALALDYRDAPRIREIVAQYRAEYPEDAHRLQEGYAIIADCLDHLDADTRARAARYWETQTFSTNRRYVRRYCLER